MVGPDVISVSSNPQAQKFLKRVEREATHRYQTLTLPEDGASNLFIVNGTLIHRCKSEAPKSDAVRFYKSLIYLTFWLCFSQHCYFNLYYLGKFYFVGIFS